MLVPDVMKCEMCRSEQNGQQIQTLMLFFLNLSPTWESVGKIIIMIKVYRFLFILIGGLVSLSAFAHDFYYTYEGQTLTYTVIDEQSKTCKTKDGYLYQLSVTNFITRPGNDVIGSLTIPEIAKDGDTEYTVTSIGGCGFYSCSGLTSVEIPNSVTSIGDGAFSECPNFETLSLDCENIGSWFSGITSIKTLNIGDNVKTIGEDAFRGCSGLTSVEIPASVTSIGENAFNGCSGLTSVEIPKSITLINLGVFEGCSGLTSVEIPNSVTSIGAWAFSWCSSLTSVEIPNSVTSIGHHAFSSCSALTSIEIPNSVTSIGEEGAFSFCSSLTSVEIPNSITSIDGAFIGCSGLTSIEIPNSVTSINRAFVGCSGLTSIEIPNSVTSIDGAFENCSGLTSIEIPNSVTSIGRSTFYGCRSLTSVTIPNSVTTIDHYAFSGCSGLTSIEIPNSVTSIGTYAFEGCSSLTDISCMAIIPPSAYSNTFDNDAYQNARLTVPQESMDAYKGHEVWKNFRNTGYQDVKYVEIDETEREVEVFNLNGIFISNSTEVLAPGIYIVRNGDSVKKIVVK